MLFETKKPSSEPQRMPVSGAEIEAARTRCLALVRRRAAMSSAVAVVPIPGLDLVADITGFAALIDKVNSEFGLTEAQIERLHPQLRVLVYKAAAAVGGVLVGKFVTRGLVMGLFKRVAGRMAVKTTAKMVPLAGQIAAVAIGYTLFKKMGDQHVEACASVARELDQAQVQQASTDPGLVM